MNSDNVLETFLSQCDNGFIEIDDQCRITSVNNAVTGLSGFSVSELQGKSLGVLFDEITTAEICNYLNGLNSDETNKIISGELLNKTEDPRWVEIHINRSADADGNSTFWLLVKNESFRKEMEDKLRQSELMLHTALESLPFDFWINDAENRTFMQNSYSKALWGDVKGRRPGDVTADDEISRNWIDTTTRALNGEIVKGEISYIIDGRKKYFRNILAPIRDEKHMFGILGMNIDITDLKTAVEMSEMLIKEVHHRIKNNLQMIISIIKLEESGACSDEEQRSVLSDIIHRIEAVSMIHERLYRAGDDNIVNASGYLDGLVKQLISGSNIADIEFNFEYDLPDIHPNKTILLGLIINELVTNSLKYAFNSKKTQHIIELKLKEEDGFLDVFYCDNGPGLPPGFVAGECNSLGFRMMMTFVEQLGGHLEWENAAAGCVFHFLIPIKKAETV